MRKSEGGRGWCGGVGGGVGGWGVKKGGKLMKKMTN